MKVKVLALGLGLMLTITPLLVFQPAQGGANVLINPGFEKGFVGWVPGTTSPAQCTTTLGTPGLVGVFSLRLLDDTTTGRCYASQPVGTLLGNAYEVCALIAGEGQIRVETLTSLTVVTGTGWTCAGWVAIEVGATITFSSITSTTGDVWFDSGLVYGYSLLNELTLPLWASNAHDANPEINEAQSPYAKTCVVEEFNGVDYWNQCPEESTGMNYPIVGRTILDAEVLNGASFILNRLEIAYIPPGPVTFLAFYGKWNDTDLNGIITDLGVDAPTNEYARGSTGLYAIVEPGNHPPVGQSANPETYLNKPYYDFEYAPVGSPPAYYMTAYGPMIFLDGSLIQSYTVTSIADSRDTILYSETYDYHRVDIDVYSALAPAFIETLYDATLAPVVNQVHPMLTLT